MHPVLLVLNLVLGEGSDHLERFVSQGIDPWQRLGLRICDDP